MDNIPLTKINTILLSVGLQPDSVVTECNSARLLAYIDTGLKTGVCHFQYIKVSDGSIRNAYGTTNPKLIPSKLALKAKEMFEVLHEVEKEADNGGEITLDTAVKVTKLIEEVGAGHKPAIDHGLATITYYDLECQAFRSFLPENLLAIY
jgi:hypothetical protein